MRDGQLCCAYIEDMWHRVADFQVIRFSKHFPCDKYAKSRREGHSWHPDRDAHIRQQVQSLYTDTVPDLLSVCQYITGAQYFHGCCPTECSCDASILRNHYLVVNVLNPNICFISVCLDEIHLEVVQICSIWKCEVRISGRQSDRFRSTNVRTVHTTSVYSIVKGRVGEARISVLSNVRNCYCLVYDGRRPASIREVNLESLVSRLVWCIAPYQTGESPLERVGLRPCRTIKWQTISEICCCVCECQLRCVNRRKNCRLSR